jgi:hypothetical protein
MARFLTFYEIIKLNEWIHMSIGVSFQKGRLLAPTLEVRGDQASGSESLRLGERAANCRIHFADHLRNSFRPQLSVPCSRLKLFRKR